MKWSVPRFNVIGNKGQLNVKVCNVRVTVNLSFPSISGCLKIHIGAPGYTNSQVWIQLKSNHLT